MADLKLDDITCCVCGIIFGLQPKVIANWRISHKQFTCPNGHILSYPDEDKKENEIKNLTEMIDTYKKENKELKSKLTNALNDIESQQTKINMLEIKLEIWEPSK